MAKKKSEGEVKIEKGKFDWSALIPKIFPCELDKLNPYANNPRINDKAIPYVKRSIKKFGFIVPIVVDDETSLTIAAGHTRYAAAKQLCEEEGRDISEVRVLCLSAEHLTPSQIKQFRLADNRVATFSEDDKEKLGAELRELLADWDATDFGFTTDDWDFGTGEEEAERFDDLDENGQTAAAEHTLRLDKVSIQLTDEEYDLFMTKYNDYVARNGVTFGFIAEAFGHEGK